MSIINSILGRPDATIQPTANSGVPAFPQLSGAPTSDIPGGPVPGSLGTDTYQPVSYRVPTASPAWIPGAVTAWRAQETMAPAISTRQVAVTKTVPVEVAPRVSRAAKAARSAEVVETAGAAETTAATEAGTAAKTATRTRAAAKAAQTAETASAVESQAGVEAGEAVRATRQVKTIKTKVDVTPKVTTAGLLGAVKTSALVSGGLSLALNGYAMIKGQETLAEGGSNVVGDVAAGAVGGLGGALASSFGVPMIASALGIAGGFPLTALTFGVGLAGYWVADKIFRKTGLFQSIKQDVFNLLSGKPAAIQNPTQTAVPAAYGYPTTETPIAAALS